MATRADSLPPYIATPRVLAPRLAEFANDNVASEVSSPFDTAWRRYASALPTDAFAIIEPDPLAGRSGGRAREGRWRLRFRPRSRPFVDPLSTDQACRIPPPVANATRLSRSRAAAAACESATAT